MLSKMKDITNKKNNFCLKYRQFIKIILEWYPIKSGILYNLQVYRNARSNISLLFNGRL